MDRRELLKYFGIGTTIIPMANGQPEETPIEDWIRFSKDDEVLHATD